MRNADLDDLKDEQYAEQVKQERKEVDAMPKTQTTIETLTHVSAMLAREGIDSALQEAERKMRICEKFFKDDKYDEYSKKLVVEYKISIQQLGKLRADLHGRAFDAYKEENPDYVR